MLPEYQGAASGLKPEVTVALCYSVTLALKDAGHLCGAPPLVQEAAKPLCHCVDCIGNLSLSVFIWI